MNNQHSLEQKAHPQGWAFLLFWIMRGAQVWGCRDRRERGVCAADPVERGEPRARGSQSELSDAGFPARSSPARGFPARSFRVQASRRVAFRLRLPCVGFRGGDSLVRAFQRGLSGAGFPTQGFQGWGFSAQASRRSPRFTAQGFLPGAGVHGARLHGAGLPETGFTALVPRRSPRFTARGFLPGAGVHGARLPRSPADISPGGRGALANSFFPNSPPCADATKRRRVFGRGGESDFGVPA